MVFPWQDGWLAQTGDPVFCFVRPPYLGPLLGFTHCFLIISGASRLRTCWVAAVRPGSTCLQPFSFSLRYLVRYTDWPLLYCFSFFFPSLFRAIFPYCQSLPLDFGELVGKASSERRLGHPPVYRYVSTDCNNHLCSLPNIQRSLSVCCSQLAFFDQTMCQALVLPPPQPTCMSKYQLTVP